MITDRWHRLNEIFHAALAVDAADRTAFIARASAGDESLQAEVQALLVAHQHAELDGVALERFEVMLDEPDALSLVGRRLGAYRIEKEIGRGGMGSVWLAERVDGQFDQQVAIKVIKRGMDTAQVLQRFRAERQILASLDHPNIARLIDGGTTDDGLPYFVMEHIEGRPIDRYADERSLDIRERLELFLQACDAVSHAHQHLIVHRDIKPQNILVTDTGVPKLLDFGIAKVLQGASDTGTRTLVGFHLLTPDYASPEQVEGRPTTTQTDVYSLGVVLYELLTGRSPYRPATWRARDVCESVLVTDPERPSTIVGRAGDNSRPDRPGLESGANRTLAPYAGRIERLRGQLRGDLDAIVLSALRKEPARRYASVEQLAGDLRRHLAGLPVRARADSVSYRAGKFVRRNRAAVTAGVLVTVALVGGAAATAWQAREARIQARLAQEAQGRAERRFAEVRKLANTLLIDYYDAIKDLPGATVIRERMVRDALEYLNGLAQEAAGDSSLQLELAEAYRRVAEVQGGMGSGSLGHTAAAIESHRKSLGILETLLAARPENVKALWAQADGTLRLADLLSLTENQVDALANARRASQLYERLLSGTTPNLDQRLALAKAYDVQGAIELESGRAQQALKIHERQLALLVAAPAGDRLDPALRRALSVAYQHLADAQGTFGDHQTALAHIRRSVELRVALSEQFPHNTDFQRILAGGYYWEADTLNKLGRTREALGAFLRSLALDEAIAAADPRAERGVFVIQRVGNMLEKLGEYAQALRYYDRARTLSEAAVKADPENLWKRAGLIELLAATCSTLANLGQTSRASARCQEAVTMIEQTRVEPTNAVVRASLAGSYQAMADAYVAASAKPDAPRAVRLEQAREAREMYRRSAAIWADMAARKMLTEADDEQEAALTRSVAKAEAAVRALERSDS